MTQFTSKLSASTKVLNGQNDAVLARHKPQSKSPTRFSHHFANLTNMTNGTGNKSNNQGIGTSVGYSPLSIMSAHTGISANGAVIFPRPLLLYSTNAKAGATTKPMTERTNVNRERFTSTLNTRTKTPIQKYTKKMPEIAVYQSISGLNSPKHKPRARAVAH